MKLVNKILAVAAMIVSAGPTWAAAGDAPTVRSVDEALAGQLGVTSNALTQIMNEIKSTQKGSSPISNKDFIDAANEFNAKAEQAMKDFERYMEENLLKRVKFYLDRLESIKANTAYTEKQKADLLSDTRNNVQIEFYSLSRKYRAEIYKLLTLALPDATTGSVTASPNTANYTKLKVNLPSVGIVEHVVSRDVNNNALGGLFNPGAEYSKSPYVAIHRYWEDGGPSVLTAPRNAVFKNVVLDKCQSSTCVVLYSGHLLFYMRNVMEKLNKELKFDNLEICGFNTCSTNSEYVNRINLYFLKELAIFVTPMPGETQGWPFDYTEAQERKQSQPAPASSISKDAPPAEQPKKSWWQS